jgi:hypothetical protein
MGLPMDSHIAKSRQIVAKDFSPPLSERGSLSRFPPWVPFKSSVWTYEPYQVGVVQREERLLHLQLQRSVVVVEKDLPEIPAV